jgi:hypothetical protein
MALPATAADRDVARLAPKTAAMSPYSWYGNTVYNIPSGTPVETIVARIGCSEGV